MYSTIHKYAEDSERDSLHITLSTTEVDSVSMTTFDGHTSITIRFGLDVEAAKLVDAINDAEQFTNGKADKRGAE
jgi:hypothetical protein